MKRYLLFAGDHYYPSGGWRDFQGSFDTGTEAVEEAQKGKNYSESARRKYEIRPWDWWQVIDSVDGTELHKVKE